MPEVLVGYSSPYSEYKRSLAINLGLGVPLYILFASMDAYFTLEGMGGDLTLEANPIIRTMMEHFGLVGGLFIEKALVFVIALLLAFIAARGIERESGWVYWFTLTPMTERWMRAGKRRFVAYLPLYLVTLAQAVAAFGWLYLLLRYGRLP